MNDQIKKKFDQALKLATGLGADSAKISLGIRNSLDVSHQAGRLKEIKNEDSIGFSISVLVGGRIGRASGNNLSRLDELVRQAVTLSEVGSQAHFDVWPEPSEYVEIKQFSPSVPALTMDQMIADSQFMTDQLMAYNSDMFIQSGASRWTGESLLMTSSGICHASKDSGWSLGTGIQQTRGTDMLFAGDNRRWGEVNEFYDREKIVGNTIEDIRRAEQNVEIPSGAFKAIFPPEYAVYLFHPVYMGINGRSVAKGDSPLAEKLGEQLLDGGVTIEDCPHVDFANGASERDSDGIPTKRQHLVKDGVLQTFLYDLDSAGLAGANPTGNNGCSPYRCVLSRGTISSDEMVAGVEDGVLVKGMMGYGQGNLINGDFSCNLSLGYRIKNGEIIGRVKDTMVSGNIYDLLKQNVTLSRDSNYLEQYPWVMLEGLEVSTRVK